MIAFLEIYWFREVHSELLPDGRVLYETNSVDRSPYWEAYSCAGSQEIT